MTKQGHQKFDNFLPSELVLPRIIGKKKAYLMDACLSLHILVRILEAEPKFIRL